MRFLSLFVLLILSSSGFASFPWLDTFESENPGWTANTPVSNLLTDEYNATIDSLASSSLKLQNPPFQNRSIWRSGAEDGNTTMSALVQVWFYDDGETTKSFDLGVIDQVSGDAGNSELRFSLSVRDGFTSSATGQYLMTANASTTSTGVARSVGWHFVEFVTRGAAGTQLLLDGMGYPGSILPQLLRPEDVSFNAGLIDENSGANNAVWIDDAHFRAAVSFGTSDIILEPLSSRVGPWSENVENFDGYNWDGNGGLIEISTAYNHSPEMGASKSIVIGGNPSGLRRPTELQYPLPQKAKTSFWFYDDGRTTAGYQLGVLAAKFAAGPGKLSGKFISVGVLDSEDPLLYGDYIIMEDVVPGTSWTITSTGIPRSTGWHYVEFETAADGLTVRLDNQAFAGNFFPDLLRQIQVYFVPMTVPSAQEANPNYVWVDDIEYERIGPNADVKTWQLY